MTKEVKKELFGEKWGIYENGVKVGETKKEGLFGDKLVTYNTDGQKVSETKRETDWRGREQQVTYDVHGQKLSETRREGNEDVIYQNGHKIGKLKRDDGVTDAFFDTKRKVLKETSGYDVDLTRRSDREKSTSTKESSSGWSTSWGNCDYERQTRPQQKSEVNKAKPVEQGTRKPSFPVYSHTSPEAIKSALNSGAFGGVRYIPDTFLIRYKCDRCGHEWDDTALETFVSPDKFVECRMGCSSGADGSLLGWFKILKGFITGSKPFGYGRLIQAENFSEKFYKKFL